MVRSRATLIGSARGLLIANAGASLSDIARHSGIGRATLYRHFESREKLINAIALDCLQAFDQATENIDELAESGMDAIRLLFTAIVPLGEQAEFLLALETMALQDAELSALRERQRNEMVELMEFAKSEGSIRRSLPTAWLVNVLDSLLLAAWQMKKQQTVNDETLAAMAFDTWYSGTRKQS